MILEKKYNIITSLKSYYDVLKKITTGLNSSRSLKGYWKNNIPVGKWENSKDYKGIYSYSNNRYYL